MRKDTFHMRKPIEVVVIVCPAFAHISCSNGWGIIIRTYIVIRMPAICCNMLIYKLHLVCITDFGPLVFQEPKYRM